MSRDHFSQVTKRIMADRAGHRCSNPGCRRATSKADPSDECNSINLGIAAHIKAASPGGPRYDSNMTSEERSSGKNGVWLCQKCAKEIDSAESAYSVDLLHSWKKSAEMVTARDAAATPDEIGRLVAEIEKVSREIHAFIGLWSDEDPTYGSYTDFAEYSQRVIRHGAELQRAYDEQIGPLVSKVLTNSEAILGSKNAVLAETVEVSLYARTNYLGMKEMARTLDNLRETLLLR